MIFFNAYFVVDICLVKGKEGDYMKILTLNTHSLVEDNYENKLMQFVEMMLKEMPDIVALQEVNQSMAKAEVLELSATGYVACKGCEVIVREDNHAYRIAKMLKEEGIVYQWTWIPAKMGYGIYDEGLALFCRKKIENIHQFYFSKSTDYDNWKIRRSIGICIENTWFYSVHMGWWEDKEEPFAAQWDTIEDKLLNKSQLCYLMGDFNSPAHKKAEGYDYIIQHGWVDTWNVAKRKDTGVTVGGVIDGWDDKMDTKEEEQGIRIDYIFCNQEIPVKSSEVVFNGKKYPVISDHYGVMIETE